MGSFKTIVTGICAFTPGVPASGGAISATKLRVIMPASNRRRTQSTHSSVTAAVIPVHVPFLATSAEYVTQKPTRPFDLRVPIDPTDAKKDRLVWLLNRDMVTFSADASDTVRFAIGTPQQVEGPPLVSEQPFVHWIADMRKIWKDRSKIRTDCTATTKPAADVAAHVEFNGGTVSSYYVNKETKHVVEVIPKKTGTVKQVLTRKVMVELPFTGSFVTVKFKSLEDSSDLGSIRLDGTDLDVMLGNVTLQDVVDLQKDMSIGEIHEGRDNHFELYYDILTVDSAGNTELPAPVRSQQGAHQNCPPLMAE